MNDLIEKLGALERDVSSQKGEFSLFGLFLREDSPGKWDLVVAAPWLEQDQKAGLDYLAKRLLSSLTPGELVSLSRIVLIEEGNPVLEAIQQAINVEHNVAEISESNFSGLLIKQAYVITSKRLGKQGIGTT